MGHLDNIGNTFSISLPVDDAGFIGRQCPEDACRKYFKVKLGTGLKGDNLPFRCPYCGYIGAIRDFPTEDQIEYAQSLVTKKVVDAAAQDLNDMARGFNERSSGGIISLHMDVKASSVPLHFYGEKKLETDVVCDNCTLMYSIYGVFAFCPDCGQHNSLQTLKMNLVIIGKMLKMADTLDSEMSSKMIENALEDCVSSFDGFGRELCRIYKHKANDAGLCEKISFQNIDRAKQTILKIFGNDIALTVTDDEWKECKTYFQKRHLLSHTMGIVDDDYIAKTGDLSVPVGRKINILTANVLSLVQIIDKMARGLTEQFSKIDL